MKAIKLKTEYLKEPLGIDIIKPQLFWNCDAGIKQTAYQIVAKLEQEIVWDSGKVLSDKMSHIAYEGNPLNSRDRIDWSVKLWDENHKSGEWQSSCFELGLLFPDDWRAKWISGDYTPKKNTRYPVDYFCRNFTVAKPVKKARLYITACGIYEATLGGKRVGEFQLAPGTTDYRHRLQYQSYDVTALLQSGGNTLEIQLADGWYRGSIGCFGPTNVFGRQTKLLCQLEICHQDGTKENITSDESFGWSNDGPLRFADLKDGEVFDASLAPTHQGKAKLAKEKIVPTASNNVQPKEHEIFSASLLTTPSGKKVLDFGQNIAGFVSFKIAGKKGQKITLIFGETLDENGEFTQENFQRPRPVKEYGTLTEILLISGQEAKIKGEMVQTPLQKIEFFCSGGEDNYKMRFSIFGFRYALIETEAEFVPEDFKAIAVYSSMEQTGEFVCSNQKVNRFVQNTSWSMKGNFLDVPTDCPTRERLGWTGDAQVFFNTGAYFMDVATFYRKWLVDAQDGQFKDGKSSAVVPYNGTSLVYDNTGASVGWADFIVLVPFRFYKLYNDERILHNFYKAMRKYAMFMIKNAGPKDKKANAGNPHAKYIYEKGMHLGEWLEPEEFKDKDIGGRTLRTEECTAYLHYTMWHMAEIAQIVQKPDDEKLFKEYAEGAKKAYNYLFLRDGVIDTHRQAKLVRPLALGLVDGNKKTAMQLRLVKAVENRGYRIGTGFLSTPFVLPTLTKAGRADVAYKMLENETAPSWLAEVNAGATTVWEDWEGNESHNHYSPGSVCEWLFDTVAGIQPAGKNHFTIAPIPGGTFTYAAACYQSLYGKVSNRWDKTADGFSLMATVPPNTTAEIHLPDGSVHHVGAGEYTFEF